MICSDLTLRYFGAPPCVGELEGADVNRGAAGSRNGGTWVQFDVWIVAGRWRAVRFRAFGCPHVIAVASWVSECAQGAAMSGELPESVQSLQRRFDVPIPKLGRLLIVEDAWRSANRAAVTILTPGLV